MFALSSYSLALVFHLVAATVLVGGSVFAVHVRRAMLDAKSAGALRLWLDFARRTSAANPVAAFVLLGTGLYLGSGGWWAYGWFHVAVAAWIGNSLLATRVMKPAGMALSAAMAGAPDASAIDDRVDALRRSPGWRLAGATMLASDVAMLFLMVQKPSLVGSIAVVLAAIAVGIGVSLARSGPSTAAGVRDGHRPQYNSGRDDERAAAGA